METQPTLIQLQIFTCEWCGKPLPSGRTHRKTHDGCRQKYFRWRKNQIKRANEAINAIDAMGAYLMTPQTRDEAVVWFEAIERKLVECYRNAGIARRTR